MSITRSILVVGATGKQGGALIRTLLDKPTQSFNILALTRSKTSSKAQSLAKHSNVSIIEGDLDHIDAIFNQIKKPLYGVFAVPILDNGIEKEQKQMQALIEASIAAKVQHIVFTATDRGGDAISDTEPTIVPHFQSKYNTELMIKDKIKASGSDITYTFIRPVAFYDNFNPGFFGSAHMTMWSMNGMDNRLQMISTKDIGIVAADAFLNVDSPRYKNKGVSLAAESLSPAEIASIFREETGKPIPTTFWIIGALIRYGITDLRRMYTYFKAPGFNADIPALKEEYPFLQDFRTWLKEESGFKKA